MKNRINEIIGIIVAVFAITGCQVALGTDYAKSEKEVESAIVSAIMFIPGNEKVRDCRMELLDRELMDKQLKAEGKSIIETIACGLRQKYEITRVAMKNGNIQILARKI